VCSYAERHYIVSLYACKVVLNVITMNVVGLCAATLSVNLRSVVMLNVIMMSVFRLLAAMLSVIIQSIIMLNEVIPNVMMSIVRLYVHYA
jgi:hypothetical protein